MGLLAAAIQGDKSIRAPPAPRTTESATMSSSETAEANRLRKLAELQETLELGVQAREAEVGGAVDADAPHKTTPARSRCQVSGEYCICTNFAMTCAPRSIE